MNKTMFRATSVGLAFANAAIKSADGKPLPADQSKWIERKVFDNMEHTQIGVRKDKGTNAHLKFSTANKLKASGIL